MTSSFIPRVDLPLRDALEAIGCWVTVHPSGAIVLFHNGETFTVFPDVDGEGWSYRAGSGRKYDTLRREKVVHAALRWFWTIK